MKKNILLILSLTVYLLFISPVFYDWNQMIKVGALLVIIEILWIGRVFSLAYSSLILIILVSFHFLTYEETIRYMGSGVVWLLFSTYIISNAFIESGLAYRISLHMLKWSKGIGSQLLLVSFFLMFVLSLFVPSNIGRGSLVSSLLDSIVSHLKKVGNVKNLAKALFIGLTYTIAISGGIVATGASSTIYAYGLLQDSTDKLNYMNWFLLVAPPIFVFIFVLWIVLKLLFPLENIQGKEIMKYIDERLIELGPMKREEMKMVLIIGITVLLWMTESFHHFPIPLVGMLGAILTMMPWIGFWSWEEARMKVNWDMIIFFASTLILSNVLIKSGAIDWLAKEVVYFIPSDSNILLYIVMLTMVALLRIIFVNVLGFMTIIIPLALIVGQHANTSPLMMAMAAFLAGVPGFFIITQSPVHMISFSYGHFSEKELRRTGSVVVFIWTGIILISALFYWNLII